jgi:serine/threonine protein kinase HipA of HipAB toxin-antitoxin module
VGVFVGYLLLDALIGNQDRHHENWGLIKAPGAGLSLSPTFDHASSLGRNELDAERIERLTTKDSGRGVAHYVRRARSGLYRTQSSRAPLTTLDAFLESQPIDESGGGRILAEKARQTEP